MRRGLTALFTWLLILCVGCHPTAPAQGGSGLALPRAITKIVSLSPSTTEILGELQLTDYLVGRTANCDEPPSVKGAIVVVNGTKPDFEKIAKISPDLIVYDAKLYLATDLDGLKQSNPMILKMDVNNVDDLMDFILQLGRITGQVTLASEEADKLYSARERARGAAPAEKVRIAVLSGGTGEYYAAGKDSFIADVVKNCGGDVVGPPGNIFAPMAPEQLVAGDPQIILVAGSAKAVLADSRLASVQAIKSNPQAVFEVPENYLYRPGPKTISLIDDLSNRVAAYAAAKRH